MHHHFRGEDARAGGERNGIFVSLLVFLAAITIAFGLTLKPADAATYQFTSVQVVGNDRIEPSTILKYAGIAKGKAITDSELNDAYQRVSQSGLFQTVEMIPQGAKLVIKVQEFPTINVIAFEGNNMLKDEALAKLVKSQSRRVYSPSVAEADAAAITAAYREAGRYAAIVSPKIIPRSENRVDLVFEIQEGKVVENERLSFIGNKAYSDRRLRQVLATKQSGIFHHFIQSDSFIADRVAEDKQRLTDFYNSRGYIDFKILDATTQITRERSGFFMTFTIEEGQSYKFGKITASSDLPEITVADFQAALRIRSGVTYSPTIIENNGARLEELARQKGLNFIQVVPKITRNDRDLTLDVDFQVKKGPKLFIERIDIEGNTTTLDQVVRRQFKSVEGDPFNPREIRAAADRIKALGYFSESGVSTKQGSGPDQVIVDANVKEQPTGSLSFGVSYGVDLGPGVAIAYSEKNFLGRGQTLTADVNTTQTNAASQIYFEEPALLNRDLKLKFRIYYNTSSYQYSFYNAWVAGVVPAIEFPIGTYSRLELRYTASAANISNISPNSSPIIRAENGTHVSSGFGYTYSRDTREKGLNPNGGVLLRFGQDFYGFGGDVKAISSTMLVSAETKTNHEEVTLRAEFEGGILNMLSGNSSVANRFFLNNKIHGFQFNGVGPRDVAAGNQDALGGNYFAVVRLETEFPLGLPSEYGIHGGLFLDAGSVWGLNNIAGAGGPVDASAHLRSSIGFSLFWDTAIGPLRFNFAKALVSQSYDRTQVFDFTISTRF